jgi:hypothetical protein
LDYYTSGGTAGCPALLVEPSAANGILNSQDTATNWTLGANLTSGYTDVIGVSGNNLTVAVSGSSIGAAAGRLARFSNNVALASGSTYTVSFLMRQTGTHTIGGYYAAITGAAAGDIGGAFDVSGSFSSGSIFNTAGVTSRIRRVERFGADVYRCSETFTMTASGTLTAISLGPIVSVVSSNNSAVGTQLAFAAPQIELGAIPTSFIPTTTAAVTRNADVVTLSGAVSGCIGQTEGTIYAEVDIKQLPALNARTFIDVGSSGNRVFMGFTSLASNTLRFQIDAGVGGVACVDIRTVVANAGIIKVAVAYQSLNCALYVNGVQATSIQSNIAFSFTTALSALFLGSTVSASAFVNDRIRAVALYTTRLTDSELAALTT